jgi:hypothetical protein
LNNVTSDIQAQINNIEGTSLNHNIVPVTNSSGALTSSTVSATTLGYLDATSSVQTQLNGKQASLSGLTSGDYIKATGAGTIGNASVLSESGNTINAAGNITIKPTTNNTAVLVVQNSAGTSNLLTVDTTNNAVVLQPPNSANAFIVRNGSGTNIFTVDTNSPAIFSNTNLVPSTTSIYSLGYAGYFWSNAYTNAVQFTSSQYMTVTGSNLLTLYGMSIMPGTDNTYICGHPSYRWSTVNSYQFNSSNLTASTVLVSDASKNIASSSVTSTTLGYLDATSSIQTQLNNRPTTAGLNAGCILQANGTSSITNNAYLSSTGSGIYCNGILSIQTAANNSGALNIKNLSGSTVFNVSTVNGAVNIPTLTASSVLVTDASSNLSSSSVTSTTLGYLDATSSIQTQLNGKQASLSGLTSGYIVGATGTGSIGTSSSALTAAATTLVKPGTNSTTAFQVQNSSATAVFTVDNSTPAIKENATVLVKPPTNSTTAFQVQNASGTAVFTVDNSTPVITPSAHIIPPTTNTYNLGSSGATFGAGYFSSISIGGNVFNGSSPNLYTNGFNFLAYPDNSNTCGGSGNRWTAVYATNGTIQTSDGDLKTNITALPTPMGLTFINALQPKSWNWTTGDTTTVNYGLVYQDVAALMTAQNIGDIALVEHPTTTTNDDGTTTTNYAGMNYTQLIGPMILAIQQLSAQVTALQAQVAALHS